MSGRFKSKLPRILIIVTLVLHCSQICEATQQAADSIIDGNNRVDAVLVRDLAESIEPIRIEHHLPSLAAAVWVDGAVVASGATGVRRLGTDTPISIGDKYHIGSCGKSMTATIAAILVEEGKLSWETTIAEVFPERAAAIRTEYQKVTLKQLLSHTAGLPDPWKAAGLAWHEVSYANAGTPTEERLAMMDQVLTMHPIGEPGKVQEYSNHGYGLAGAIIENVTDKSWEVLVHSMIFEPLGMSSGGVGQPSLNERDAQPWGHVIENANLKPIDPSDIRAKIPGAIACAGDVHCSIEEFAIWAGVHVQGLQGGESSLVSPKTFKFMHTPVLNNYALGWRIETTSGGTEIHMHGGSDDAFYAMMAVIPELNIAVVSATNAGNGKTACNDIILKLANAFAKENQQ